MSTTALDTLLPLLALPRCPENMRRQALRVAARRFCRDTGAWRERIELTAQADEPGYALTTGLGDATVRRVDSVHLDGARLRNDRWSVEDGGHNLTIDPAPTADGEIEVYAVVLPGMATATLPTWIVESWGEGIASLASANLKLAPGSRKDPAPWHDPEGAAMDMERYLEAVANAKADAITSRQSGVVSITQPRHYI